MNKQRKVLITITYNEMGIIIDTKAEEVAQPDLQPTCNQLATDCISRQEAIRWAKTECNPYGKPTLDFESGKKVIEHLEQMPSAQPEPEDYTEIKQEFLRMASYIDVLLECSDEQRESLMGFISRLAEYMPWTERD